MTGIVTQKDCIQAAVQICLLSQPPSFDSCLTTHLDEKMNIKTYFNSLKETFEKWKKEPELFEKKREIKRIPPCRIYSLFRGKEEKIATLQVLALEHLKAYLLSADLISKKLWNYDDLFSPDDTLSEELKKILQLGIWVQYILISWSFEPNSSPSRGQKWIVEQILHISENDPSFPQTLSQFLLLLYKSPFYPEQSKDLETLTTYLDVEEILEVLNLLPEDLTSSHHFLYKLDDLPKDKRVKLLRFGLEQLHKTPQGQPSPGFQRVIDGVARGLEPVDSLSGYSKPKTLFHLLVYFPTELLDLFASHVKDKYYGKNAISITKEIQNWFQQFLQNPQDFLEQSKRFWGKFFELRILVLRVLLHPLPHCTPQKTLELRRLLFTNMSSVYSLPKEPQALSTYLSFLEDFLNNPPEDFNRFDSLLRLILNNRKRIDQNNPSIHKKLLSLFPFNAIETFLFGNRKDAICKDDFHLGNISWKKESEDFYRPLFLSLPPEFFLYIWKEHVKTDPSFINELVLTQRFFSTKEQEKDWVQRLGSSFDSTSKTCLFFLFKNISSQLMKLWLSHQKDGENLPLEMIRIHLEKGIFPEGDPSQSLLISLPRISHILKIVRKVDPSKYDSLKQELVPLFLQHGIFSSKDLSSSEKTEEVSATKSAWETFEKKAQLYQSVLKVRLPQGREPLEGDKELLSTLRRNYLARTNYYIPSNENILHPNKNYTNAVYLVHQISPLPEKELSYAANIYSQCNFIGHFKNKPNCMRLGFFLPFYQKSIREKTVENLSKENLLPKKWCHPEYTDLFALHYVFYGLFLSPAKNKYDVFYSFLSQLRPQSLRLYHDFLFNPELSFSGWGFLIDKKKNPLKEEVKKAFLDFPRLSEILNKPIDLAH